MMKNHVWMCSVLCRSILLIACVLVPCLGNTATNGDIAVLGSSVAKGNDAGGSLVNGSYALGYAGLLTTYLEPLEWGVTNLSVNEDSTTNILDTLNSEVLPANPDQVLIGLSLADEGLVGASDPAVTFESFRSGLTNIIGQVRANDMYAMTGLCYPHNDYSLSEYEYLKAMNLLINTYNLPSANFLGAVDDGEGHWVEGYYSDAGHPNAAGHKEMFYTIVPSLFDAIRLGKTTSPSPASNDAGYAIITRDPSVHAPIKFTPEDTVHSFTTAFRVRSGSTGTVASVLQEETPNALHALDRIFVDFGPNNSDRGHLTPSPDQNGNHWNNLSYSYSASSVPVGIGLTDLIKTSGASSAVDLEVTAAFAHPNGGSSYGGLMAPEAALLGDFAVTNATEDYFCTGGTSKFKIKDLDNQFYYTLRFFGTRVLDGATRTTRYTASAGNGTFSTNMVTTGTDVGTDGYDGNNDTIAELSHLKPNSSGEIEVSVTLISGYAYLSIMEIQVEEVKLSLSDRMLVDFGPEDSDRGHAAPSPDQNGNYWNSWQCDGNVNVGNSLPDLIKTSGAISPIDLEVTAMFSPPNGGTSYGGLMAPDPALLGDFAVTNATEDYFNVGGTGKFKIKGLDKRFLYTLRLFGTRVYDGDVRTTRYSAIGGNGSYSVDINTTGTDIGTGGYDGNNDTIVELSGLLPDGNGEIEVSVTMISGHAYLNIMEITVDEMVDENDPDSLLIDFGPDDGVNGHAMSNPDSNGRYWNNFVPPYSTGNAITDMIDSYSAKTSTVALTITSGFTSCNGINHGGLLAPDPALLGYFAQAHATEDYFHTNYEKSSLKISGLNEKTVYTLRFFGTRENTDTRETRFTAQTGNGTYVTSILTTGIDIGTGGYDGNNDTIADLKGLVPDTQGCIYVDIDNVQGIQCYLGAMEIKKEHSVTSTGNSTVELRTNTLVYVASTGHEIRASVDADNNQWHDVAVAHCHAGQKTRLFVDGVEIGHLTEQIAPTSFVLGGEGTATTNRMAGPQQAQYQDWCVYRSAWNEDEASAQVDGNMQQASMEICAALSDSHFIQGESVNNRAQSLSEAVVNSSLIEQKPTGTLIFIR